MEKNIGVGYPPYIIAELSGNHNGSLPRALKLVEAAANCGVDAIKLQTYTADTITLDLRTEEFVVIDQNSPWGGRNLHELYHEAHTPWDWHAPIVEKALSCGLEWLSTPFDLSSIGFLEQLGIPAYKIASPELVDHQLIAAAAATGKPIIMSTGMATLTEIAEAVDVARSAGCHAITLLKCTTAYPASPADANLRTMQNLKETFGCEVGLSDHTLGVGVAVAAAALGASIIEKHMTLRRADGGPDSSFSLEPDEMATLVRETKAASAAVGTVLYGGTESEQASKRGRRSLYIVKDVRAGEKLTSENVRSIRPGYGLSPRFLSMVVGRKANTDLTRGTALHWEHVS